MRDTHKGNWWNMTEIYVKIGLIVRSVRTQEPGLGKHFHKSCSIIASNGSMMVSPSPHHHAQLTCTFRVAHVHQKARSLQHRPRYMKSKKKKRKTAEPKEHQRHTASQRRMTHRKTKKRPHTTQPDTKQTRKRQNRRPNNKRKTTETVNDATDKEGDGRTETKTCKSQVNSVEPTRWNVEKTTCKCRVKATLQ